MIRWDQEDEIAILRFARPPVNALDDEMLGAFVEALTEIRASGAEAVVLTGEGTTFSAGADLFRVLSEGEDYLDRALPLLNDAFEGLFRFERPVVAAVNGHAIAGGAVFTCACDYRIAAAGDYQIGVAEVRVGVPFPVWALEVVRAAVPKEHLREIILLGRSYPPERAREIGLIDEVVAPEKLMESAFAVARTLARVPADTFRITKRALQEPAVQIAERRMPDDRETRDLWASDPIRAAIQRTLEEATGKKPDAG